LRLYDSLGLFRPAWVDRDSGYRYYSAAQLPELRRIVALRDTGMPLVEIRRALADGRDLRTTLAERRDDLERQRREIERRLAALEIRVDAPAGDSDGSDVVLRWVPREPVATLALSLVDRADVADAFYELESRVRDLGRRAHRPPGALIPEGGGEQGIEIYVPLKGPIEPTDRIAFRVLPPVRAATTLHRGDYDGMPAARRTLERWTAAAGLTRAGPLRVLYLQFGAESELRVPPGWVVERASDFLTELQLPVE
jgi:DNA-binding transcriptional MerR regulator